MSTIKTTNITHGSNSGTANLVLASDGGITFAKKPALGRQILEQFLSPCDGSVIALNQGNTTLTDVTGVQTLSTSYADVTGSSISYTPPTGTTQVIYEFYSMLSPGDAWAIPHFKLFLDSDEVVYQRKSITADTNPDLEWFYRYAFNIGGSANTNTGRVSSWSSAKTIKVQAREYSSSYEAVLHQFQHWDGSGPYGFHQPSIGITAIG